VSDISRLTAPQAPLRQAGAAGGCKGSSLAHSPHEGQSREHQRLRSGC